MRRWYEPRKDRPDLTREAVNRRGFVGFLEMLWREFFELIKLNLLFLLTCLPVVTIPASISALCYITTTMVSDRNHFLWQDYWKAFRRDFFKALAGGAIAFAILGVFCLSTVFYYRLMYVNRLFVLPAGFSACLVLLSLTAMFYFFPMVARVELPVRALLKNAAIMTFFNIKKSLPALGLALVFLGLGVGLLPVSAIFVVFIMFSFTSLAVTYLVYPAIEAQVVRAAPQRQRPQAAPEGGAAQLRSASVEELVFEDEEGDNQP